MKWIKFSILLLLLQQQFSEVTHLSCSVVGFLNNTSVKLHSISSFIVKKHFILVMDTPFFTLVPVLLVWQGGKGKRFLLPLLYTLAVSGVCLSGAQPLSDKRGLLVLALVARGDSLDTLFLLEGWSQRTNSNDFPQPQEGQGEEWLFSTNSVVLQNVTPYLLPVLLCWG